MQSLSSWIFHLLVIFYWTTCAWFNIGVQPLLTLQHAGRKDDQLQRTDGGFSHTSPSIIFTLSFPHFFLILLSWTPKTDFYFLYILCFIRCFHSSHRSCLSLMPSCLSFILSHTLPHRSVCLSPLLEQLNSFQLFGHAKFVPRAIKLKVMQIKCSRAMYINL